MVFNNSALLQVISTYASMHQDTFIDQNVLFQIISTCIKQNYEQLFSVKILNEVVATYINANYRRLFNYELLEDIFKQYNYEYATSHIKVEELTKVIIEFIQQHQEIFENNEVLYEIIYNYMQTNKTIIFSEDLLLEIVNNFISEHKNYINEELLEQIVFDYMDQHKDVVVDNEVVVNLINQYLTTHFTEVFSQDILVRIVNVYIERHYTTIFSETLIREVVNNYLQTHKEFVSSETIELIISNYLKEHETEVFSKTFIKDVVEYFFREKYNIIVTGTTIENLIEEYVSHHSTEIFSHTTIIEIVNSYMSVYFERYINEEVIVKILDQYFDTYKEIILTTKQTFTGPITDVDIHDTDGYVTVTLENGQQVRLTIYGAADRLRDRVQSIVPLPKEDDTILKKFDLGYSLNLYYLVTPASIAKVIADQFKKGMEVELKATDKTGNISTITVSKVSNTEGGILNISAFVTDKFAFETHLDIPLAVALHVKETKDNGADIMSEFIILEPEDSQPAGYLDCPDDHHPHKINLGLPSGTLWSCCNVGASAPKEVGDYFAWGETKPKSAYNAETYAKLPDNIAGTIYDAAKAQWGDNWIMPTSEQWAELIDNCETQYQTTHYSDLIEVTGTNGGKIVLPYAGYQIAEEKFKGFCYWSATRLQGEYASFVVEGEYSSLSMYSRPWYWGIPVRPVAAP